MNRHEARGSNHQQTSCSVLLSCDHPPGTAQTYNCKLNDYVFANGYQDGRDYD